MTDTSPLPPLPDLADTGTAFWRGGERGELRIGWCPACEEYLHPALAACPSCLGADLTDVAVSGRGTIVALSENHQRWLPGCPPPYLLAFVALEEAPHIRLTTNIVECEAGSVGVGTRVAARFLSRGDVWLPVFAPVADAAPVDTVPLVPLPATAIRPMHGTAKFEDRAAISGIGMSRIGRRLGASPLALTLEACEAAIADAGLTRDDIDGISAYPGSTGLPGLSSGGVRGIEQILRLRPSWHCGAQETPGQGGTVIEAMLAVASGLCRHVLCFTSFAEAARPAITSAGARIGGELAWHLPFGAASPANWIALYASHYLARFGASRDMLAEIALSTRRHAALNPQAIFTAPLTRDDYYAARMISSPFGLYDCDIPCDGAIAVIVSAADAAADLRHPPIHIEATGTQLTEVQSWDQGSITHQANVFGPAAHLWTRTSLRPADVDVALLYDGFTFNVVSWLEGLGFCGIGEARDFLEGGANIALDGTLPLNPHGGHLSAGRTNGWGNIHEAVVQLRGMAGARQVREAKVAAVSLGGGIPAGCMLLRRD